MADDPMQGPEQVKQEPQTLAEAFSRMNTTIEEVDLLAATMRGHGGPEEYDQGDRVNVAYDDLYDLAYAMTMAIRVAKERGFDA